MSKATILIVEDDAILAMDLQRMITELDYTVVGPLASGEEAIIFILDNHVDLVLMDIELAGAMNGIRTAETLHQTSDIPIIFLTGFSGDPLLEQAKIAAPYGYLIKPVPERELEATLEIALHRHSLDRQLQKSRLDLARSEEKYRQLFENSPLGIFRTTLDGRALAVNVEMARIVGCTSPEEAITDFSNLAGQFYVDPERRREFITQLTAKGAVQHFEYEGQKKNGETLWISMNANLTKTDATNGQAGEVVIDGFALDITDRKRAEETLRDSEAKFRSLAESSRDYIMRYDRQGRHTYMNPAALAISGLTETDILGKTHRECGFPEELCALWEEKIMQVFASGEPYQMEFSWNSVAGPVYLDWQLTPEHDAEDRVFSVLGVSRDITERKQVEQNYQTLFREMLNGFALHEIICNDAGWPVDYRFLAVNPAFEQMTGLQSEDVVGRSVREVMPGIEDHWIKSYGRVAITGEPAFFESSSGDLKKYFEVTAYRPAPNQFACIFANITERRKAEDERKNLQQQLQQAQKMEAIGTLAGGIAHDFNNILGAVLGYAEMARDDCPAGSPVARDLDQVIKASHRAKDLVKQILAFSRQAEYELIPLQPSIVVKETLQMLRSSLPSTIAIHQDLAADTGTILADPTQIHQIIMNLCTNAFHAMEESGGVLSVILETHTLTARDLGDRPHVKPGDFIHIAIGDTGQGIAPEIRDKIFDPFFTTKEIGKGTGMGLSIVYGIVDSYGGFVSCDSQLGKGTVFHITLPILPADHPLPQTETVKIIPIGSERILFVDDEPMLSEMGQSMLQRLGYHVTVRGSSLEALSSFQNEPNAYDLVITDQTMPGITGIDMARRMLQIRPDLPIILCTGYSSLISEKKAMATGIKGFALKPLAKKDIAALIRKVLRKGESS